VGFTGLLSQKKEGTYRFCVDYRRVNTVSRKDAFPVPDIQYALDHLSSAKYFAIFDLLSRYWQLGLTERAKERSAFCTRRGLFQFTRMPFGLAGAPSSVCPLMSIVLRDMLWKMFLCYLDDIVIYARTPQELLERLRLLLDRLRKVGLKVKPSKCALFQSASTFWATSSLKMEFGQIRLRWPLSALTCVKVVSHDSHEACHCSQWSQSHSLHGSAALL